MKDTSSFHCCATCEHFVVSKGAAGVIYFCSRLTYETKPTYKFDCWQPKEKVRKLMKRHSITEDNHDST
jgi:hypothetical protein